MGGEKRDRPIINLKFISEIQLESADHFDYLDFSFS